MNNNTKKILIAEDDDFMRNMYESKLSMEHFEVVPVVNGEDAVKTLNTEKIDLVLLDIMMPKLNGFEVLSWIRNQRNLKKIPVILLTNLSEGDQVQKGLSLGANDYIVKAQFTPEEVVEKIKKYITQNV